MQQSPFGTKGSNYIYIYIYTFRIKMINCWKTHWHCLCRLLLVLLASALSSMVILFILASQRLPNSAFFGWKRTWCLHLPLKVSQFQTDQIQHQPSCRALHLLRRKVLHRDATSDMLAMPGFRTKSERCRIAAPGTRYFVKVLNFLAFIKKDISDYHEHLFCKVTWSAE